MSGLNSPDYSDETFADETAAALDETTEMAENDTMMTTEEITEETDAVAETPREDTSVDDDSAKVAPSLQEETGKLLDQLIGTAA